jgi:predicted dehydrogenase
LGLAKTYGNWEDVIQDPGIDAVLIGTWPYMHCPVTLAALDAGKHVLTQARMAINAREAQRMLDRAREATGQVAMVAPSPYGLAGEAFVRSLIADGFLGSLREVHVDGLTGDLRSFDGTNAFNNPMTFKHITSHDLKLGVRWDLSSPPVYAPPPLMRKG